METPTLPAILTYGMMRNIPESLCRKFYEYNEGRGWRMYNGEAIGSWTKLLESWFEKEVKTAEKADFASSQAKGQASSPVAPSSATDAERAAAINAAAQEPDLRVRRKNTWMDAGDDSMTPEERQRAVRERYLEEMNQMKRMAMDPEAQEAKRLCFAHHPEFGPYMVSDEEGALLDEYYQREPGTTKKLCELANQRCPQHSRGGMGAIGDVLRGW